MLSLASRAAVLSLPLVLAGSVLAAPQRPGRTPRQVFNGQSLLSAQRLARVANGTHALHTTREGHRSFVALRNGRVAGMHMVDAAGRTHRPNVRRVAAARDLTDGDVVPVALCDGAPAGQVAFNFDLGTDQVTYTFGPAAVDASLGGTAQGPAEQGPAGQSPGKPGPVQQGPGKPYQGKPYQGKPEPVQQSPGKPYQGNPSQGKPYQGKPGSGKQQVLDV
jgi:hypothetical protein